MFATPPTSTSHPLTWWMYPRPSMFFTGPPLLGIILNANGTHSSVSAKLFGTWLMQPFPMKLTNHFERSNIDHDHQSIREYNSAVWPCYPHPRPPPFLLIPSEFQTLVCVLVNLAYKPWCLWNILNDHSFAKECQWADTLQVRKGLASVWVFPQLGMCVS